MNTLTSKTIEYLGRENLRGDMPGIDSQHIFTLLFEGLNSKAVRHTIEKSGFYIKDVAQILGKTTRWIERLDNEKTLPSDSAERLVLFSLVLAEGEEAFGSMEKFKKWLNQALPALQGRSPLEYLRSGTYSGFEVVRKLISLVRYGDFIS